MRILAVCGSLQARSANHDLLDAAVATAPEGVSVVIFDGLRTLPHFDLDIEASGPTPESVAAWRRAIAESDALLVACPEYGFSLPGALKNGIDWVIGSGELERKVVAITASVPGEQRGRQGLAALAQTLSAVSARMVGGKPMVRGDGFRERVAELVRAVVEEVAKAKAEREREA